MLVMYRYAVLGHEPGAMLLLAVAQQALLQLDSFSPQELTNMVSAAARLLHWLMHVLQPIIILQRCSSLCTGDFVAAS